MMDAELYLPSARSTSRMIDMHTLADTFGLLAPTPPAALVGDSPRRAIATLTRCLPATLTNWQHLECRLDHSSAVDLIVQVEGRVALTRLSALSNGRSHPGWMGAGALAAAAAAADVPRALEPLLARLMAWRNVATAVAEHRAIWRTLDEAVDAADARADAHIGILHLDVDRTRARVAPRFGVEYMLDRATQARGCIAERAFLHHLVSRGLATAEKAAALEEWPSVRRVSLPHQFWPSIAARRVNHIKVTTGADGATSAKAYLCLGERWRSIR